VVSLVRAGSREHALRQPEKCASWLTTGGGGEVEGAEVDVLEVSSESVVLRAIFEPPPVSTRLGFPAEEARILISRRGDPWAVPTGAERKWKHIYRISPRLRLVGENGAHHALPFLLGALCLWYPDDQPHLLWSWDKGLGDYVRILQRHLWFEEFWRRTNFWPTEDAPHGMRLDGKAHPILTESLRKAS
jgi:hypothetical protein